VTRSNRSSWLRCALTLALGFALLAANGVAADEAKAKAKGTGISKPVAEKLLAAYELLQGDKYDESLALVDALAERRRLKAPEIAQIHRFRGYIYVNKGMSEQAAAEFEKSLAQKALDPEAEQVMIYSLAQIYTQLGKYDQALALMNTWFQAAQNPKPDAYYLKAMILVQQERFAEAVEPAKRATELSPEPRESWVALQVVIYSQLKDYPNVAAALEQLIAISPNKPQYWVQLAAVQKHLEREARALATLQLAHEAKLLREDKEVRQLARLLFLRQQPYECAQVVEMGIASGVVSPDAESYKLMSNCYIAARDNDKALEPLAKAGELATDGDMYMLLGQMYLQRERFAPAIEALEKALAKSKPEQRGSVQLLIGVAQLGSDRFDDAERAFRVASGDERVRRAAESYLTFLKAQRLRHEQQQQQAQTRPSRG
jgi:tetratricopeptide (TPR) repeat protein